MLGDERSEEELEASAIDPRAPLDPRDDSREADGAARCVDGACPPSLDGKGTLINTYA